MSLPWFYNLKPTDTNGSPRKNDPPKQNYLLTPKGFADRPLIIPQESLFSTDFVTIDPDWIPTEVSKL